MCFIPALKKLITYKSLDSLADSNYMFNPVLVNTKNLKVAITESDLDDYPGMFLRGTSSNALQSAFAALSN